MDSLIEDIQKKVAKYVTCSEAIHNAVVLTRNQTLADVEKIIDIQKWSDEWNDDFSNEDSLEEHLTNRLKEEIKNLKDNSRGKHD